MPGARTVSPSTTPSSSNPWRPPARPSWSVPSKASPPADSVRSTPTTSASTCGARFWSPSYFAASCGGAPLSIIKECIENQKRPQ
ncbi:MULTISPECIES: transposase [unclassified Streptomyces]|uniref:transposase n=1 Tax=unclassified Streptomyces TaxID=2593676 RepID=UPI0035C8A4D7